MEQAAGNARAEMQTALRKSRAARLRRRIAYCDTHLAMLVNQASLTEEEARRGLVLMEQRRNMREHLARSEAVIQ